MHCAGDIVMCLGDFNGHVGRHIDGFNWVHGGYGVGLRRKKNDAIRVVSGEGIVCVIYMA